MPTYQVTTDKGTYQVDTQDSGNSTQDNSQETDTMKDLDSASTALNQQPNEENQATGGLKTTVGAVGSGLMKGAESMLETAQGGSNIIGNAIGIPSSQDFGNTAKDIESSRQALIGNQDSLHGKVLEAIGQLPSIIAMMGSGEGAGLLGMRGGAGAFGTQAALQAQPQTQGQDIKKQIGNMAWQGTKAAAFGAVLGKASKMGTVPGTTLAASYSAAQSALQGGDPNDILAGAITGAGLNILSNPKNLAYTWSGTKDTVKAAAQGAKNILQKAQVEGTSPLGAASSIVGTKVNDWYQNIKAMNESPDRIADIDQEISQAKTQQQEEMDKLNKQQQDAEQAKKDNIVSQKSDTTQALTMLEREKTDRLAQIDSQTEDARIKIGNQVDSLDNELNKNVFDIVNSLKKGGRISNLFAGISNAYETALNNMGEKLSTKSPITRLNMIDMLTASLGKIADSNYNVPSGTRITGAVNDAIDMMKQMPLKPGTEDSERVAQLKAMGVPSDMISAQMAKRGSVDMNEEVPFGMAKSILTKIKNSDPFGSHEADIVRHTFGDMIGMKLGEGGEKSPEFDELQSQMSDAISYKNKLAQIFALKQGIAYPEGGVRFLTDVANGKEGNSGLLKFLESGTEIAGNKVKGVGDVSSEIKQLGTKLQSAQESFKNVGANEKSEVVKLGQEFAARMDSAQKQGQLSQERINLEHKRFMQKLSDAKETLDNNYQRTLKELGNNKYAQQELLRRKTDVGNTINAMGVGVGAFVYKVGALARLGGRLFARKSTGIGKRP
jgi:hypothetical protein